MPTPVPKVCAVILNLADTPCLLECLRSLEKAAYGNLEIVVVHNGPRSEEFDKAVRGASSRVSEVLFTGYNAGFAAGSNAGMRAALSRGAEHVLLLNDDTVVAPDFLGTLTAQAEADGPGMFGPRIFYFSEPEKIWFTGAAFDSSTCSFTTPGADLTESVWGRPEPADTDYVTGCCLLVSRKVLETIGLLDERFFLYWEDADWCFRARARGFRCGIVPSSRIWHKVSSSTGGEGSPLKTYYKARGRLLFSGLHAPGAKKKIIHEFARDAAWLLLKSGAPDRWRKAWAYIKAVLDNYMGRGGGRGLVRAAGGEPGHGN